MAHGKHFLGCLVLTCFTILVRLSCVHGNPSKLKFPDVAIVKTWAARLGRHIDALFLKFVLPKRLEMCYEDYTEYGVSFKPTDREKSIKQVADDISKILQLKMEALKKSVAFAELEAKKYAFIDDIKPDSVEYVDAKLLRYDDSRLKNDPQFKANVMQNMTSVHIPVEIYKGNVEILNGLKWTSNLAKVFIENQEKDPKLLWQYFGSQAGFLRSFPGKKWVTHGTVDLFDVRRRSWYTQGSSSPKDMLILIDTSGSVHGQALQLIKVSVNSLLDTLGDDDFVNIVQFSGKAKFVSCFQTFVQANYHNKKVLIDHVKQLKARGMADFKKGLTFAFEEFKKFRKRNENNQGARCNEVIMLLTDGGSDTVEDVFKEYNPDKRVRVFTYAIGPTASPTYATRWMACFNKGYFSQIPAMGAIRSKVQGYLVALKGIKEAYGAQNVEWTGPRYSVGLGMMTTVTLPVYNRTADKVNQTILGVMGTDILVDQFMEKVRDADLGPISYAFAINSNGYIVFHPNQKAQLGWVNDPPNVDILDVEFETEKLKKFRKDMIDLNKSDKTINDFVMSPSYHYLTKAKRVYYSWKIAKSDFTLAIVEPPYERVQPVFTTAVKDFKHLLSKNSASLIAKWPYYKNYVSQTNSTGTLSDLITANNTNQTWNDRLVAHLQWDIHCFTKEENFMILIFNQRSDEGVKLAFFTGSSGFTSVYPKKEGLAFMKKDPRKEDYFQRTMDIDGYVLSIRNFRNGRSGANNTKLTITKALKLKDYNYKPAVLGLVFDVSKLSETLEAADVEATGLQCQQSDDIACYILDDGAFLIATNQDEIKESLIGEFFGNVDQVLMTGLLVEIYQQHVFYDYQASCSEKNETTSSAFRTTIIPSLNVLYEFLSWNWWSSQISWAFVNFNVFSWLFSSHSTSVYANGDTCAGDSLCIVKLQSNKSCIKKGIQYSWKTEKLDTANTFSCNFSNCKRSYATARIRNTNLLLVVSEKANTPDCKICYVPELKQKFEEHGGLNFCHVEPRYRRRPLHCFSNTSGEASAECGSAMYQPSAILILFTTLLVIIGVKSLTYDNL